MEIIDFDSRFFDFAREWAARHPGMTPKKLEESYNEMMDEWSNTPADWLNGQTPANCFDSIAEPEELIELIREYIAEGYALPESLYTHIVDMNSVCVPALISAMLSDAEEEGVRAEAMSLLRDIDDQVLCPELVGFVIHAEEKNELSDMAADILSAYGERQVALLMDAYPEASDYARGLILDIACNHPADPRIYDCLLYRLKNKPEERALNASLLAKLGDDRAIDTLKTIMEFTDLRYLDYIELRNAVEVLGGEVGEERTFYGDPDYEALRNI